MNEDEPSLPDISTFTFGPRCPACGWKKPVFMIGTKFGRPFPCGSCGSRLNVRKTHRRRNAFLMALLVPFLAWFSFGELDDRQRFAVGAVLLLLAFFEFWFMRLELIDEEV